MERAQKYHAKLVNIKKEMGSLHEKTVQLKVCVMFDTSASMLSNRLTTVSSCVTDCTF